MKSGLLLRIAGVASFLFLAALWVGASDSKKRSPAGSGAASAATPTSSAPEKVQVQGGTDAKAQANRLSLIEGFKRKGVIYKIEVLGEYPHLYVGPTFYAASIDTKEAVAGLVLAYYLVEGRRDMLILQDGQSGKRIGSMSTFSGFDLK